MLARRTLPWIVAVSGLAAAGLAGCGDDSASDSTTSAELDSAKPTVSTPSTTGVGTGECGASEPEPPTVEPVADVESDFTMTSFDGAEIRIHWFPAVDVDEPAATLLQGPGWGLAGSTDTGVSGLFGDLSVGSLRAEGYNVLTWDPRGFGESTGTITVNSADREGRDVQRLLDWVATQPDVLLDGPGDPRVGMLGGSYGGGIANITAAIDCRVNVIAPTIAWNSLRTSLYKGEIVKQGWADLLYEAARTRELDEHLVSAHESGLVTGTISDEDAAWFADRGPGDRIGDIDVPTLIIQGTVDTLFTLDEAVANFAILREEDVPVAMLWYCGGHGVCLSEPGDDSWTGPITLHWFDYYLRGNADAELPPTFVFVDQRGTRWALDDWPQPSGTLDASGSGRLELVAEGGSGPAIAPADGGGVIGGLALEFTPGRATNAVEVTVRGEPGEDQFVVGAATLEVTYSGTAEEGDRPTRAFAQLVDDETGLVLGNQVTPVVLDLDGASHSISLPLETVAHRLAAGSSITLQIVATTTAYAEPRLSGTVEFTSIDVSLPVISGVRAL